MPETYPNPTLKRRARRNEKFYAEKAERDAARKAVMRETAGEPYHKEVATCEQLTFYLAKFKAPAAAAAAAAGGGAAPAAPPEGYKVFKKADIEDDGILALSGGAKKGGKKSRGRAGERKDDKPVRRRRPRRVVGPCAGSGVQCWLRDCLAHGA